MSLLTSWPPRGSPAQAHVWEQVPSEQLPKGTSRTPGMHRGGFQMPKCPAGCPAGDASSSHGLPVCWAVRGDQASGMAASALVLLCFLSDSCPRLPGTGQQTHGVGEVTNAAVEAGGQQGSV